jgi:hypothetical protein
VVPIGAQAGSADAPREIPPTAVLKGEVTWSGGLVRNEKNGFAFS